MKACKLLAATCGCFALLWRPIAAKADGTATAATVSIGQAYCVIDLSGGVAAESYPVSYLSDIPVAVDGVIDLASATVKPEYANEPLDVEKGAVIDLSSPYNPSLMTAPTKEGLAYTLREGATLDAMRNGATKVGDGQPWTPDITVKGGASGFYTIRVDK